MKKDAKEPSQVSSPTNPISYNANNPDPEKSKIVLHCSAGIGRTGTILAIYNIVQSLKILQDVTDGKDKSSTSSQLSNKQSPSGMTYDENSQHITG